MGIIVMLMALLTPMAYDVYIAAMRTKCRANVHAIARACIHYANDSLLYRGTTSGALPNTAPSGDNWADIVNGNPGGLWLLVTTGHATPEMFFCPEASMRPQAVRYIKGKPGDPSFLYSNHNSTLSYSYISMVGTYKPSEGSPRPFRDVTTVDSTDFSSSLVIVGDRNPRCEFNVSSLTDDEGQNSNNHNRAGQNIGALDETARWLIGVETKSGDDVYAADESSDDSHGRRSDLDDSFLLP